ncbi:MAG TPA: Spy/CpxP family protein refolding chaperone [Thermoanaerobaculia bacterium]|nr:Spy/CpxP family protein refolding chaperone [Thermoanaerobaculia bacterium]
MNTTSRTTFRILRNTGLALAAAGALAAGVAQAQEGMGHGRGHGAFGRIHRALAALDLSDTQKTQIKGFFQEAKPAFKSLREQMKSDHEALHDAVNVDRPDPTAVGNAFLKVHADREAMKTQREELRTKVESVLTDEQKTELRGMRKAFGPMGRMKHERESGAPPER